MAETSPRNPWLLYAVLAVLGGAAVSYQIRVTESRYEELTQGESLVDSGDNLGDVEPMTRAPLDRV